MTNTGNKAPKVSIGLPVYNGGLHIADAIESVLKQDFEDFELIICDNASTDNTYEICREFAQKDSRVTLIRNETNLGAAPNFNKVFHLATGEYFKWLAYDDWIEPTYLSRCVEVLDKQPEVSMVQTQTSIYSEDGQFQKQYIDRLKATSDSPRKRFMSALRDMTQVYQIFGLMRRDLLGDTMLMGSNQGADHTVVAEMALRGKIYMHPEYLNANRNAKSARVGRDHRSWWDASKRKHDRPTYTLLALQHLEAVKRSDVNVFTKLALYFQTTVYFLTCRRLAVIRETKLTLTTLLRGLRRREASTQS